MIKQLIEDLTFDRISLSQALTRAKIIAYKINNTQFKEWIGFELNSYPDYTKIPPYRTIPCDIFAEVNHPFQGTYTIPFDVSVLDKEFTEKKGLSFYKMNLLQSIPTLEEGYNKDGEHTYGYEYLPHGMVEMLKSGIPNGDMIIAVKRRIQISQINHVINTTKQRLLDTLLELNEAFPNLENDYKDNTQNETKTQTIINQTIYGDNANSNIGVGENITQSIENNAKLDNLIQELKKLGIDESDTNEVREIIINEKKENWGKKLMAWVGKMTTKAVEKGIELQVPVLIEKINDFI